MYDANLTFSNNQSLAQVIGSYLSDKSVDLWNGARQTTAKGNTPPMDPGRGNPIQIICQVTEDFVGVNGTMSVELIGTTDEALTAGLVSYEQAPGGSVTVGIPVATLKAGYEFRLGGSLPPGISLQYLGLRYNIFTTNLTGGKITAYLNRDRVTAPGIFL